MLRTQFDLDWNGRLSEDGTYRADQRFTVLFIPDNATNVTHYANGHIVIKLVDDFGNKLEHVSSTYEDALQWMVQQPPPAGSLRLGNIVSAATQAVGIKPCGGCRHRQLAWNARKA